MQPPIISGLRELDSAPRRFLLFIAFNVVSWQCIIGPALVLIARKIDMPPSWVGFLISFTPLSTVLVVCTAQLVTRFGPKHVMLTAWTLRNLITCIVFLMPLAIAWHGQRAGWYVLMAATLGFCLMRAIGAGGWVPWLHEVVPDGQRSVYFASEAGITQLLNIVVMALQALILLGVPGLDRYLWIYAVGISAGFISVTWMYRVPGGAGIDGHISWLDVYRPYRKAIADKQFVIYVLIASLGLAALSWLAASQVLYLRDSLHITSKSIMVIMALGSVGVVLTVKYWGRFAEFNGSGPCMFLSIIAHSLLMLALLVLYPEAPWTLWLIGPALILANIFNIAFNVAANRGMLNNIKADSRVGYSNVWTVSTSIAMGVPPILAGYAIDHMGIWGFRTCFIVAALSGIVTGVLSLAVIRERGRIKRPVFRWTPAGIAYTLSKIVIVSIGYDESNRQGRATELPAADPEAVIPGSVK